ncbi:MAG: DUF1573 domain-containing protein [Candidatus Syntrophonatronum acetioxidans]|uniref:DUF1573 domain-containing protein n=1 Tax=Candidatus Syntrophonatronum acetioxidans TaxID=1795816 RepID=A0A424YGB9_9FIRM|nr:MAG: DUF1573 domain-containing protein [Candidatus Syntrophonatronum acetioxidans]
MKSDLNDFQDKVDELLIRHKSILDSLSKYQETNSKVNRAIIKSITFCGCVTVNASSQNIPEDASLKDYKKYVDTHFSGKLCEQCKDIIEEKMGNNLFYLVALTNLLELDLDEILKKEMDKINTLGHFNLT